ncbi:quinone oxidoreductase family protein [Rhodococcus opacus]|uniref:quinone oxidoreductase family protein n=1 Tax=Rhodococcus opacus TaxID=37919 RepID=UPI00146CEE97|nr:quinone oxidoreductase [Rhodococcus opacus]MDJ0415392.1 quinone oxidoreductase [Rhodococcus opacus]MDV7090473.1 quinone oxidoreductase [Rhodococcus opacus]UNN04673.1 quinone oxidoreductase [Rhodococcus opacus]WKN52472.1 quinone oxidoreductase [Rhodococcus opacus]
MKAIRIERYGGPEVLQRQDVPVPTPSRGEVLVEVAFAGINFMDVHTRQGKYEHSRSYRVGIPLTLGMEGSGIVHEIGPDVDGFAVGDRVAWCISWGSYADFAVVPAARLAKIPEGIELDLAAAAVFQGCTAHYLSSDVGNLAQGTTCLIHAASGGIGQLLIQFAKRRGAIVFATTSSREKADVAKKAGADQVMLYDEGRFADAVRDATGGRGVDVVFDAVGRPTLRDSFRATRTRGLVVNYGSVAGSLSDLDPIELGEAGSLFLTRPRLADHMASAEEVQMRAADVFAGLLDGSITLSVAGRYCFDDVEKAHAALEERRQIGKAVLDLSSSESHV